MIQVTFEEGRTGQQPGSQRPRHLSVWARRVQGDSPAVPFHSPVSFEDDAHRLALGTDWPSRPVPGADAYTLAQAVRLLEAARTLEHERQALVEGPEASAARWLGTNPSAVRHRGRRPGGPPGRA